MLDQVENAIDIFEAKTNNFTTGLFMFDNAPSHQKQAPDALPVRKMLKNPNQRWMSTKGGPRMQNGWYMNGSDKISQDVYLPDDYPKFPGWFKGMKNIICKHSLWPNERLKVQCDGFKHVSGHTNCCSHKVLFCQPDFCSQKSHLEEYITSRGHICDFYPKYHCRWDAS